MLLFLQNNSMSLSPEISRWINVQLDLNPESSDSLKVKQDTPIFIDQCSNHHMERSIASHRQGILAENLVLTDEISHWIDELLN